MPPGLSELQILSSTLGEMMPSQLTGLEDGGTIHTPASLRPIRQPLWAAACRAHLGRKVLGYWSSIGYVW